jgi:hypothetical protein
MYAWATLEQPLLSWRCWHACVHIANTDANNPAFSLHCAVCTGLACYAIIGDNAAVATYYTLHSHCIPTHSAALLLLCTGVERNAIIGDDAAARKRDIPIVQLNPGGVLNYKYDAECALRASGLPYTIIRCTGALNVAC